MEFAVLNLNSATQKKEKKKLEFILEKKIKEKNTETNYYSEISVVYNSTFKYNSLIGRKATK